MRRGGATTVRDVLFRVVVHLALCVLLGFLFPLHVDIVLGHDAAHSDSALNLGCRWLFRRQRRGFRLRARARVGAGVGARRGGRLDSRP